eukprot:CAMPEP_0194676576 /NCGR_PEP_ID=MMETSP0295-20121207/8970_1 /TAXON_ID=39354 /ORGANISM="Heterosigma akashiwo, Strain CCMP2393" /LENGTH=45 /DNA_ID= /DNA_START= /DNA_END= /DNA_ORIENTATION=
MRASPASKGEGDEAALPPPSLASSPPTQPRTPAAKETERHGPEGN